MAGSRVSVATSTLRGLADRLSAAAETVRSGPVPGAPPAAAAAGDPVLAAALLRLDATAGRACSELDDDLRRLADTLRLAADAYEQAEQASAHRFGLLDRWLPG